eukprot:COSAG01_NODE_18784_length_1053_cov_2.015723_1_plen_190_part_10
MRRSFPINRGVVQGAIDSPWYFILALECIFKQCDNHGGIDIGLPTGNLLRLEYADDAALLCASISEASLRLTKISVISRKLADMEGSRPKTEYEIIRKEKPLPLPTEQQIRDTLGKDAFLCKQCDRAYSSWQSYNTHQTHSTTGCKWKDCCCDTPATRIQGVRGGGDTLRFFAVHKPVDQPPPSPPPASP